MVKVWPKALNALPAVIPDKEDDAGAGQVYTVPVGTMLVASFIGDKTIEFELQIDVLLLCITGLGLIVTMYVTGALTQLAVVVVAE